MQFPSFVPRRNDTPTPTPAPTDFDATEVNPDWSATLHRHILAQAPPASPPQTPAVGPRPLRDPRSTDGFRQGPPTAPVPQAHYQNRQNQNDQTQVFDPTDIGAQIRQAQTSQPYQGYRSLEYYGDPQIKNIKIVVGFQVHSANDRGVLITENGPVTERTLIPWHRVHALRAAPIDPILHN